MKPFNLKTRLIALTLMTSQFVGTGISFASPTEPSTVQTPETLLLTQAMVISSQDLSKQEASTQLKQVVSEYDRTAPLQGREDRLTSALVSMKFMTPQRAVEFRNSVEQSINSEIKASATQGTKPSESELVTRALQSVFSHDDGAQFSARDANCTLMIAGGIGVILGLSEASSNPTCSQDSWTTYYSDGSWDTTYGPVSCTDPNYNPNKESGLKIARISAAALGIGLIIALFSNNGFDCYQ